MRWIIAAIASGALCLLGLTASLLSMTEQASTRPLLMAQVEASRNEQPASQMQPEMGGIIRSPIQQETSSSYWTKSEMMEAIPYPMPTVPEEAVPYPMPIVPGEGNLIPGSQPQGKLLTD